MAGNSFGTLLTLTTFGESHGPAVGGVLDGCPAGLTVDEAEIQRDLDRRKPGQSMHTTQRKEADKVRILSGLYEGKTTGAPLAFIIENTDARSSSYDKIKDIFRPGHADYAYQTKYGLRDPRGGGRSSARETAVRVAAGAVAKKIIGDIKITAFTERIGNVVARDHDENEIERNPVRCPDHKAAMEMGRVIDEARLAGDSVGGVVEVRATGMPAGLGQPLYNKLDAALAGALMGINAAKGVEIGAGFGVAFKRGSENNDPMEPGVNGPRFTANHAGGILGGISTGQDLVARVAFKPTPSIIKEQKTVDHSGKGVTISVEGRHDPCVVPRAVPVVEAMTALVLADHLLMNRSSRM